MSDTLRVGSLFSGIGGIDLGLERAGMKVVWQCEANPFARRVLAKHWPGVPCYEDVKGVTNDGSVEVPDLLCGGFPCQDISFAGLGAGLDGERSGLWFEYHRIIREFRPRYVLVENVAALLVRGIDRVLGSLAAIGYDAEWECISAASVGAPHLRNRVFLVAHSDRFGQNLSGCAEQEAIEQYASIGASSLADADSKRQSRFTQRNRYPVKPQFFTPCGDDSHRCGRSAWWATEPNVGRVAHGVPSRVDRLRGVGNAVVPQVAEFIGKRIVDFHRRQIIHV